MFTFAQVVLDAPAALDAAPQQSLGQQVMAALAPVIVTLLTGIVTAVLVALRSWLTEKAKTSKLAAGLLKAESAAEAAVAEVNAGMSADIAKALEDGVITEDEKKALKEKALSLTMRTLGEKGQAELEKALGTTGSGMVGFVSGLIEKKVEAAKAAPPSVP